MFHTPTFVHSKGHLHALEGLPGMGVLRRESSMYVDRQVTKAKLRYTPLASRH